MRYQRHACLRGLLRGALLLLGSALAGAHSWAGHVYSFNNFGGIGLLDMRNARFSPDGTVAGGLYYNRHVSHYFATWQATPWLETTVRYSDNHAPMLTFVDRSFDVKARLLTEGDFRPQVAIGIQDVLGQGLRSGEYLVASKRYYDFDFTVGFSWGYLGSRGGVANMFRVFGDDFSRRADDTPSGGIRSGSYFAGKDMAFFAGLEYQPPVDGLSFKIEYSGVDTRKIPALANLPRKSPFNVGISYQPTSWLGLAFNFERGDRFGFRLTFQQNLHRMKPRKFAHHPPPPMAQRPVAAKPEKHPDRDKVVAKTAYDALAQAGLSPLSLSLDKHTVVLRKREGPYYAEVKNIGRSARVLTHHMPDEIEEFLIISEAEGMKSAQVSLLRQDLEKAALYQGSPEEIAVNSILYPPQITNPSRDNTMDRKKRPADYEDPTTIRTEWGILPAVLTHFGGNDNGRFRADLQARLWGQLELYRHWQVSGEVSQFIIGDLDQIPPHLNPAIPAVRSDIARYSKEGRTALSRLKLAYSTALGRRFYGRIQAGLFESMYGGVGAEILYRPYADNRALGLDINWVRQRAFDQLFSFRPYNIVTGHATLYHENKTYNVATRVSVGRYLAGDYGVTLDLSRTFFGGVRLGVWASFTSMSVDNFGDGSFDKGLYLTLPFEFLSPRPDRRQARFHFRNLGKDGGQQLDRGESLYDSLNQGQKSRLNRDWPQILD